METLTAARARRIALAAQGFGGARPGAGPARALAIIRRLGVLQIDSVNVLVRAHYLPLFARAGAYDRSLIERLAYRRRALFEYWGHEASLLPVELQPLFRWRMAEAVRWDFGRWARDNNAYIERVYRHVADAGPTTVSNLAEPGERAGPWWGWAEGKHALEWLFLTGRVAATDRRNFERVYDLTERVLPAEILNQPTPSVEDAHRRLIELAASALGVGTERDLADYFRLKTADARPRIAELVEAGVLHRVHVEGWKPHAYLHAGARIPRGVRACALLAPFDSLVWERARTERLFDFRYRIEIYTPAPKRVFGYYVLPFLLGDRLVGRVDLKADRSASRLLVQAAHAEAGQVPGEIAGPLADELTRMAAWLGLDGVKVVRRGDLSTPLASILR